LEESRRRYTQKPRDGKILTLRDDGTSKRNTRSRYVCVPCVPRSVPGNWWGERGGDGGERKGLNNNPFSSLRQLTVLRALVPCQDVILSPARFAVGLLCFHRARRRVLLLVTSRREPKHDDPCRCVAGIGSLVTVLMGTIRLTCGAMCVHSLSLASMVLMHSRCDYR